MARFVEGDRCESVRRIVPIETVVPGVPTRIFRVAQLGDEGVESDLLGSGGKDKTGFCLSGILRDGRDHIASGSDLPRRVVWGIGPDVPALLLEPVAYVVAGVGTGSGLRGRWSASLICAFVDPLGDAEGDPIL